MTQFKFNRPKKEIPYEVMFKVSDAQQDPIKHNRYWFNFPDQWVNQRDKDPIIGIRDIYLTRTNRIMMSPINVWKSLPKNSHTYNTDL